MGSTESIMLSGKNTDDKGRKGQKLLNYIFHFTYTFRILIQDWVYLTFTGLKIASNNLCLCTYVINICLESDTKINLFGSITIKWLPLDSFTKWIIPTLYC